MKYLNLFLFLFVFACSNPKNIEEELFYFEQNREKSIEKLDTFLQSKDAKIREKTYLAIGRIQDTTFVTSLETAFFNENDSLKSLISWVFGQLSCEKSCNFLLSELQKENSEQVTVSLLASLGKVAKTDSTEQGKKTLEVLKKQLTDTNTKVKGQACETVGVLARKNTFEDKNLVESLVNCSFELTDEERFKALYALANLKVKTDFAKFLPLLSEKNPLAKMNLLRVLSNTGNDSFLVFLEGFTKESDWRVRSNAVSLLAKFPNSALCGKILLDFLNDENDLVRQNAIRVSGDLKFFGAIPKLKEFLNSQNPNLKGEAGFSLAKISGKSEGLEELSKSENWRLRVKFLEILEFYKDYESAVQLINFYTDKDEKVVVEAVGRTLSLIEILAKENKITKEQLEILKKGFSLGLADVLSRSQSWFSTFVCVEEATKIGAKETIKAILSSLQKFRNPNSKDELETLIMLVKAVSKFKETASLPILEKLMDLEDKVLTEEVSKAIFEISGNNAFISKVKKGELFRKHFIFEEIKKLSSRESVVLETEIGKITLELNSDFAPVTVANFLELVGKGFYDGMEFHRVIGNFVAQAGCPLGNGWSGAGYQINCEYSPLRYEVGTLGMALSGKDTGGSQFFITHSPQPHLNGSYTIFGKVVFGMEFLEKAQIGTKILSVKRV